MALFAFALASILSADLQHSLFLMQQNHPEEAIIKYRESGVNNYDLLHDLGLILLQKGVESSDPQTFTMALFGAGLSGSAGALEILEKGVEHKNPEMQLLALNFIAKYDDDRAIALFTRAMSSDFLAIRMEAAYYLAMRKAPKAAGLIESLMVRLPPAFKPYFPPLFTLLGTNDGKLALKRLIEDIDVDTRIEAILSAARLGRDDFLPTLRRKLTHANIAELEATIFAVSALKDSSSIPKLKKLSASPTDSVRLAANLALIRFGERAYLEPIEKMAESGNLYAILALGTIPETDATLEALLESSDYQVRLNSALALLQRRNPACLSLLFDILISSELLFHPVASVGRTHSYIKMKTQESKQDAAYSLALREQLLREAVNLPEEEFLRLARRIMARGRLDLVPTLTQLLENLGTPAAIETLKDGAQAFSPLIRGYCNLALFRATQEGPYEEAITSWISEHKNGELITLRELLPWKYRLDQTSYALTPEETSRLLVESCLTLASTRSEKAINLLLDTIQLGRAPNRYALIGLLMKASE